VSIRLCSLAFWVFLRLKIIFNIAFLLIYTLLSLFYRLCLDIFILYFNSMGRPFLPIFQITPLLFLRLLLNLYCLDKFHFLILLFMPILLLFLQLVLRIVGKLNLSTQFAIFYIFMIVWLSSCQCLLFEYDGGDKPDSNRK